MIGVSHGCVRLSWIELRCVGLDCECDTQLDLYTDDGTYVPISGLRSWNTRGNLGNTNGHHSDCIFVVLVRRGSIVVVVDGTNILGRDGKCLHDILVGDEGWSYCLY